MSPDKEPASIPTNTSAAAESLNADPKSPTPVTSKDEHTPQQQNKIKSLEASISNLQSQISQTETLLSDIREKLNLLSPSDPLPDVHAIVKRHIRLLHEYNEIKDIGLGMMGLIADAKGVRYVDVQTEFGIGPDD